MNHFLIMLLAIATSSCAGAQPIPATVAGIETIACVVDDIYKQVQPAQIITDCGADAGQVISYLNKSTKPSIVQAMAYMKAHK